MVKTLTVLSVDPEFQSLCRDLTDEENSDLRQAIIDERGCHDPIIYWENSPDLPNPILDGHHRYEHCTAEGLPYPTHGMILGSREEAVQWMLRNQLGRRNLTPEERSYYRGKLYNSTKQSHGDAERTIPTNGSMSPIGQSALLGQNTGKTAKIIGQETGADPRTIRRDGQFAEAVDQIAEQSPELKTAALDGTIPKSAVTKLATATPAVLNRLAAKADDPKKLREATKKLTTTAPRNNGRPSKGLSFDKVEKHFGVGLRLLDDLNRSHPHPNCHRMGIAKGKELLSLLSQWKKAV